MSKLLYLDTARLGQMSPRARRASVDFARFASEYGAPLYWSDFLRHGASVWPDSIRAEYSGLLDWGGVSLLKERLQTLAQAHATSEVLIAARSASLMRVASHLLYGPCGNVLVTDLTWPNYERILRREQRNSACRITTTRLRREILNGQLSESELVERLAQEYEQNQCDGLFLPLVDNLGVQLPLRRIVERIRSECELRFVVVDGAQAIHHVPLALAADYCDFLLAGSHKWLQAFTPMGLGFYGHPRSVDYIRDSLRRWMDEGRIDDPLLAFIDKLVSERADRFGETVAVAPMISTNSAVIDALQAQSDGSRIVEENRALISATATKVGWSCLSPLNDFASRIMIFQSPHKRDRDDSPDSIRRRFLAHEVAISAYRGGIVRASIPNSRLNANQRAMLQTAFVA